MKPSHRAQTGQNQFSVAASPKGRTRSRIAQGQENRFTFILSGAAQDGHANGLLLLPGRKSDWPGLGDVMHAGDSRLVGRAQIDRGGAVGAALAAKGDLGGLSA